MYKSLKFRGKIIKARICTSLQKISGLMFKKREKAEALLFEFSKPTKLAIHSYFVFFPFIAVWLDENNKIIEIKKVEPFTFHVKPKKPFTKLLEVPINSRYSRNLSNLYNQ
jgi:uncharacterized membrane protein (UPF0127 family)